MCKGGSELRLLTPFPGDPRDPRDPGMCSFWLEIETPIEVERFDPCFSSYCRTFEKSNVQKQMIFDTLLSL